MGHETILFCVYIVNILFNESLDGIERKYLGNEGSARS